MHEYLTLYTTDCYRSNLPWPTGGSLSPWLSMAVSRSGSFGDLVAAHQRSVANRSAAPLAENSFVATQTQCSHHAQTLARQAVWLL